MKLWRFALLSFAVAQVAVFFLGLALLPRSGDAGFTIPTNIFESTDQARVLSVAPRGAADAAGIRAGDLIPLARVDKDIQWHITHGLMGRRGQRVQLPIIHAGHERTITLTLKSIVFSWTYADALLLLVSTLALVLGAVTALRGQPNVRTLLTASFLLAVALSGSTNYFPPSETAWIVLYAVGQMIWDAGFVAGALLVWTFPSARSAMLRRCILATVIASVAGVAGEVIWLLLPLPGHFVTALGVFVYVPLFILGISCIVGFRRSSGEDRRRLRLLAMAIVPFCTAIFFKAALEQIPAYAGSLDYIVSVVRFFELTLPVVMIYGLFVRRVIDLGFAINRAAVFTAVSLVALGSFVLLEWAFGEWLRGASHAENVAASAGLALVLGLSIRFIHTRVDHVVDRVFFRKRHDDERALRRFTHEASYISHSDILLSRAIQTVETHADALKADILLNDGKGRFGTIPENDPAVVALRAWHEPLDLHTVQSEIHGEYAFPMSARGILLGALVVQTKKSGESYAPDELDALKTLAHATGSALDSLVHSQNGSADAILDAVRKLPDSIRSLDAIVQRLQSEQTLK